MAIQTPFRAYQQTVGAHPLIEAGTMGLGGALAGYHGSGFAANKMLNSLMAGKTPAQKAAIRQQLEADGTMRWIRIISALSGAGLGAGYGIMKHLDTGSGAKGAVSSLLNPNYYEDNPEALKRLETRRAEAKEKAFYGGGGRARVQKLDALYDSGRRPKFAALQLDDPFTNERIPIKYTMDTIAQDPFLSMGQKEYTNSLVHGSESSDSGVTSQKSLMRSALHAGIGFGSAYAFGKAIGSIFALPQDITKRLSNVGGVAGAIINTGILEGSR